MGSVVPIQPNQASVYSGAQLQLIKNTVAKDCNALEFDLFMAVARNAGLDPFRKQVNAIVFSKDNPEKRRMSIITSIDGLRAIAARSGRYRPDENEPMITYDPELKDPASNPLGIVKAVVTINIADVQREGGWKPVAGVAYWDEFAPIKEEWAYDEQAHKRKPTGRMTLDGQWPKMGRVMIAKCAEAQALRKAFPEDLSGLYEGAEMDQAAARDLNPSEIIDQHATGERLQRIGAVGIMVQMFPNTALESIPIGQFADRVLEAAKGFTSARQLTWFMDANRLPLQEFWARQKGDALALKTELEAIGRTLQAAEDAA